MVGIASKHRLRTAAILVGAAILAVSCAPVIAPDSQPNKPTPTEVLPTRTVSPTPEPTKTQGPTKTPEPTKELRPGIDTWVEVGDSLKLAFNASWVTSEYYNKELVDKKYNLYQGLPLEEVVLEGVYDGAFGTELSKIGAMNPNKFYLQGKGKPYYGGFLAHGSGAPKFFFVLLFSQIKGTQGPFTLHDKVDNFTVDLSSLPNHSVNFPNYSYYPSP